MSNKWMQKLTSDFGKVAAEITKPNTKVISLPSPSLNWAVGNGGLTEGKVLTLYGAESGGKSLLMQLIMAQIQKNDPEAICILFDTEYSFNPNWFSKLGGDTSRLIVRQTNDPEKIFDYIGGELLEMLQEGAPVKCISIDSVKAIRYPGDMKEKTTNITMGGAGAKYLGPAFKLILPVIREYNITTLLVQQVYEELDQMKAMRNPFKVPDGRSLKHFSDYMAQVDKLETKKGILEFGEDIAGNTAQVGHKVRVKFKKNRVGAPYRTAQFTLNYEKGIVDTGAELFDLARSLGVIYHPVNPATGKENNQMWKFGDLDPVRGEDNMKNVVIGDKQLQDKIMAACNNSTEEASQARNAAAGDVSVDLDNDV